MYTIHRIYHNDLTLRYYSSIERFKVFDKMLLKSTHFVMLLKLLSSSYKDTTTSNVCCHNGLFCQRVFFLCLPNTISANNVVY